MLARTQRGLRRARTRTRSALTPASSTGWTRNKLVAALAFALAAVLLFLGGLGLAVYYLLHTPHDASTRPDGSAQHAKLVSTARRGTVRYAEDRLAARPMRTVGLDAAQPGPVSTRDPGVIVLPKPTGVGPTGVPTGYPRTPAGALAQLAALDQAAMQTGSLSGVRAVISGWAARGGPTPESWSGVQAMADFLSAAGLSGGGSGQLAIVVTPLMGLIKGTVGAGFVIPCVDFQFDVTLNSTQHVAVADCQRMLWQRGRWVIGPGKEPADPPSVWAGTDLAISVGYRDLVHG
jgi:hypothetical protein